MVQSTNMDIPLCWLYSTLKYLSPEIRIKMWHDLITVLNLGGKRDGTLLWRVTLLSMVNMLDWICTSKDLAAQTMYSFKIKICDTVLQSAMVRSTVMFRLQKWNTQLEEGAGGKTIYTSLTALPMSYRAPSLVGETRAWRPWNRGCSVSIMQ